MRGQFSHSIKLDETAPSQARALLQPLQSSVDERCFQAIRQVVTELVAQCVHDGGADDRIEVSVKAVGAGLVEVVVSRPSRRSEPERPAEDGWIAFRVVEQLVEGWGVREDDERVTVWLRLATPNRTRD